MNPINQMLSNNNGILNTLNMLKAGNPNMIYQQLLNSNPQFKNFIDSNKGKTPDQIASDYGIDMGMVRNLMK